MFRPILLSAACILAVMVAVKDGRFLRTTGITGACSVVQLRLDGSELAACRPGKLEGRPDLHRRGCTDAGIVGTYQYWRCPAPEATN
jgi:hypothetical protein